MRTMGIEEEFVLVDAAGDAVAVSGAVVRGAPDGFPGWDSSAPGGQLETELKQEMLETGTQPCTDLTELLRQVRAGRRLARDAAGRAGAVVAALGTFPRRVDSSFTPVDRYREIGREFALTARENLTCGCHVHVEVEDDDEGVAVLDRIGPWLPVLLALSSNSPFWHGEDTGYASFRSQVWSRWPTAGPTAAFGSAERYRSTVRALVGSGTILDAGMVYFDARLSAKYPTVELRVSDVCLRADDAALLGGLARALVDTAAADARAGRPAHDLRAEQLRAHTWRAGRSGMEGVLVSPRSARPVPAWDAVAELLHHVGPALRANGDDETVADLLQALRVRGTGSQEQRAWAAGSGRDAVPLRAAEVTTA